MSKHIDKTALSYLIGITGVILILAGVTYGVVVKQEKESARTSADVTKLALPDGSAPFTTLEGDPVAVSYDEESVRVVSAWASWCPSCKEGLLLLDGLASRYDDVTFIAVNRNENPTTARAYLETLPELTHLTVALDANDHFFKTVEGYAMPETVVYDKEGVIVSHLRGAYRGAALEAAIIEALER